MIQVENLTKRYGPVTAIEDVSFNVEEGEILGFLGPNGAGKSTTMRIITGFTTPTRGKVLVDGDSVEERSLAVRRKIGYLPENTPLYTEMTVSGYLRFVAQVKGVPRSEIGRKVQSALEESGAASVSERVIGHLSKGYRQRIGLAQALVNDPPVLILDEPTVGLDPRQIIEIRDVIKKLAGQRTIILSTHILPEVSILCNRVVIINKGRIVAVDTPSNLQTRLAKGSRIDIEVDGPKNEVIEAIRSLDSVTSVEENAHKPIGGHLGLIVSAGDKDMRPELAALVASKGWTLYELQLHDLSLEEIFVQILEEE